MVIRFVPHLHIGVRNCLHFRALGMFCKIETLPICSTSYCEVCLQYNRSALSIEFHYLSVMFHQLWPTADETYLVSINIWLNFSLLRLVDEKMARKEEDGS